MFTKGMSVPFAPASEGETMPEMTAACSARTCAVAWTPYRSHLSSARHWAILTPH